MNIREAKEEIKRSVAIYLEKNEYGDYRIPCRKQRPVMMMGAPGIGKTAIVRQAAAELDVALVICSMAHYTRRSALGRPFTRDKRYRGKVYPVVEYTLGDIMAAIYRVMERSGRDEGILFLDEINCTAESLAPAMLLLLQYKMLGTRRLTEGWVVVAAGNPPQYNRDVREFGISTLDRIKLLDVKPDFEIWREYARQQGTHPSVVSFLEIHPKWFYYVQVTSGRKNYVTARGWDDLSEAIRAYERKGFLVDQNLICQYIAEGEIVREFEKHYNLFQKIWSDYQMDQVIREQLLETLPEKAEQAEDHERIILNSILLHQLNLLREEADRCKSALQKIDETMSAARTEMSQDGISIAVILESALEQFQTELAKKQAAHSILESQQAEYSKWISYLKRLIKCAAWEDEPERQLLLVNDRFNRLVQENEKRIRSAENVLKKMSGLAG